MGKANAATGGGPGGSGLRLYRPEAGPAHRARVRVRHSGWVMYLDLYEGPGPGPEGASDIGGGLWLAVRED